MLDNIAKETPDVIEGNLKLEPGSFRKKIREKGKEIETNSLIYPHVLAHRVREE